MKFIYRLSLFVVAGGLALAQTSKLSPELQNIDSHSKLAVIVQFDKDPSDAYHQKVIRRGDPGKLLCIP